MILFFDFLAIYIYNYNIRRERKMEEIKALVDIIVNNGIGVACVLYMIYFQATTMKEMNATLNKMNNSLELVTDRLENIEAKINKTPKKKEKKEE